MSTSSWASLYGMRAGRPGTDAPWYFAGSGGTGGISACNAVGTLLGVPYEQLLADAARDVPVGRVGQPEDVAAVVAFLCSDEAGYVSGQTVYVAGGPRG